MQEFPTGRRERITQLEAELDDWLITRQHEIAPFLDDDEEEDERLIRYALYKVSLNWLDGYVNPGPWLRPPFPEYDEEEEVRVGP